MTILRAGCYERVSTDEQAKYGYSIRTQISDLTEYCQKNQIKIVDHYTDEGVSGGKPINKRPQLMRLIEDVKAGKIDIILFTKLDRWSRNTKEFFKAQDILDELKVEWKAIHERYDTTTPDGRMAITIFLAIAQNEREKNADRVTRVFADKRKRKEAWFGSHSMPFGYTKEKDESGVFRLVKDPELRDAVQDFWDITIKSGSAFKAMTYVNETYGLKRAKKSWYDVLHGEIYTGKCREIENYCEPYVSYEDWKTLQDRTVGWVTQRKYTYLFSGLIKCPGCGRSLKATYMYGKTKDKLYFGYRCNATATKHCDYKHTVHEIGFEKKMLARIENDVREKIKEIEEARAQPKNTSQKRLKSLKEQLRRLEVVYMSGNKSDDDYIAESMIINSKIREAEAELKNDPTERDTSSLQAFLDSNFKERYAELSREEKKIFWSRLVQEIQMEGKEIKSVELNF